MRDAGQADHVADQGSADAEHELVAAEDSELVRDARQDVLQECELEHRTRHCEADVSERCGLMRSVATRRGGRSSLVERENQSWKINFNPSNVSNKSKEVSFIENIFFFFNFFARL